MPHSFAQSTQADCPQCGQPVDRDVWLIVDLAERPDLAAHVRDGTLHAAPCPHCGHSGQIDVPLLLYLAECDPPLLFSPAQNTTAQQDQAHAADLVGRLRASLGDAWQDAWLAEGLPGVPRPLLPALLQGDDPQAALEQMLAQATQEMERLRREDPEAFAQLQAAARQEVEKAPPEGNDKDLADKLIAWIQTPDWGASKAYLQTHADELLTDEAEAELERLRQINPENAAIPEHQTLLRRARELGIAAMYADFHLQRMLERLPQSGPLGAAVARLIEADDDASTTLLQTESALLLTLDAGDLLRQLVEAAGAGDDERFAARMKARYQQWQTARLGGGSAGEPPAHFVQTGQQVRTQINVAGDVHGSLSGARYEIDVAAFSAVGDNAVTLNVLNFGAVTLQWQRPQMTRPDLAERAVGRRHELDALRSRLCAADQVEQAGTPGVAIVGKSRRQTLSSRRQTISGRRQAVSGMPGVGKSTLAALYAHECAASSQGQAA
jgi:hypothetical protein